jgi:quinol monooxygenase YgiN
VIHVIATVELKEGQRDLFLGEFQRVVPLVRAETGCLEYGPALDLPTDIPAQAPPRPDVVVIIEKWDSLEALRAHLTAPHMAEYRGRVKDAVAKVHLQVLEPA